MTIRTELRIRARAVIICNIKYQPCGSVDIFFLRSYLKMLENNTYIDFMKKHYNLITKIMDDNVVSENEIILIDY